MQPAHDYQHTTSAVLAGLTQAEDPHHAHALPIAMIVKHIQSAVTPKELDSDL